MLAPFHVVAVVALGAALALGPPDADAGRDQCPPEPALLTLDVTIPPEPCVQPGETVQVTLSMSCLDLPVIGYQVFLEFDSSVLSFVQGSYTLPDPFGLPILYPIVASGDHIDLAAGVNPLMGQQATMADADLVLLTFEAAAVGETQVRFRLNDPATALTADDESELLPALVDSPTIHVRVDCSGSSDFDRDGDVDLEDFARFARCVGGPGVTVRPPGCTVEEFCMSDADDDEDVDLNDYSTFANSFTG